MLIAIIVLFFFFLIVSSFFIVVCAVQNVTAEQGYIFTRMHTSFLKDLITGCIFCFVKY